MSSLEVEDENTLLVAMSALSNLSGKAKAHMIYVLDTDDLTKSARGFGAQIVAHYPEMETLLSVPSDCFASVADLTALNGTCSPKYTKLSLDKEVMTEIDPRTAGKYAQFLPSYRNSDDANLTLVDFIKFLYLNIVDIAGDVEMGPEEREYFEEVRPKIAEIFQHRSISEADSILLLVVAMTKLHLSSAIGFTFDNMGKDTTFNEKPLDEHVDFHLFESFKLFKPELFEDAWNDTAFIIKDRNVDAALYLQYGLKTIDYWLATSRALFARRFYENTQNDDPLYQVGQDIKYAVTLTLLAGSRLSALLNFAVSRTIETRMVNRVVAQALPEGIESIANALIKTGKPLEPEKGFIDNKLAGVSISGVVLTLGAIIVLA